MRAMRAGRCPIPADTQGQAERGFEQLMELWVSLFIAEGVGVPYNSNHSIILWKIDPSLF